MRSLVPFFAVLLLAATASAVPLPAGARWFVYAPKAGQFARDAEALLTSASQHALALSPRRLNSDLTRSLAIGLVQTETLNVSGVDTEQPWMLFERNGASYLAVTVKDRKVFTATLDGWAEKRLLKAREETTLQKPKGATMVTYSRAQGTRAAAAFLIAGDRAIVLTQPSERTPALADAYAALESAAPVQPGVEGSLIVWLGRESAVRDGWVGLKLLDDGIDVTGVARQIDAGFVERDNGRAEWIRALTAAPNGGSGEVPAWARFVAGSKTASQLVAALAPTLSSYASGSAGKSWIDGLRSLATGPLELLATDADVAAVERGSGGGVNSDLLRLMKPAVLFPDRPATTMTNVMKQSSSSLCDAKPVGDDAVRAMCVDPALTVGRVGKSLFVGWTGAVAKPTMPGVSGAPALSCAKGTPIAAARLSPAVVGAATREVGLLSAFGSQSLAGMLAIGTEYGRLMRASQPAIGLACQEPSGRVTMQGRWRFTKK